MKKNGLFKIVSILLVILVVVSYIIPGRNSVVANIGLIDVVLNFLQSFYYFFDTALFILVIGGLYGVLNKTGAYKKLLDNIAGKLKGNSKQFIVTTIIVFSLIVSITGITLPLFIFIPFVVSIILLLGYDKLVAVSSTFGAVMAGLIGGVFVNFKNPNDYYSVSFTTFEKYLNLEEQISTIFPKLLLLVLTVILLILYVLKHIKDTEEKKVKYELNDNEKVQVTEVKGDYKKIKVWPLVVMLILLFILLILGLTPWSGLFGVTVFDKFNTWLTSLSVHRKYVFITVIALVALYLSIKNRKNKKVLIPTIITSVVLIVLMVFSKNITPKVVHNFLKEDLVVTSVFTSSLVALGSWASMGSYLIPSLVIILFTWLVKCIYKIELSDVLSDFLEGTKKALPTAFMLMFAFTVLVCSYNNGFIETIIGYTSKFNIAITSLITILGSVLHMDLYYTVAAVLANFVSAYTDVSKDVFPVLAILFQSIYGLVTLIAPTSVLLIIGLTYYDIPYTTWLKYIWRLVLRLMLLIVAIVLLVTIIL